MRAPSSTGGGQMGVGAKFGREMPGTYSPEGPMEIGSPSRSEFRVSLDSKQGRFGGPGRPDRWSQFLAIVTAQKYIVKPN